MSTSNRLQYLVPNLVEAMFTDFPGRTGETVRISVAPENQPAQAHPALIGRVGGNIEQGRVAADAARPFFCR